MRMETGQGNVQDLNRATREIWDSKARFWDEQMGEGNQFQRVLVGPVSERLLQLKPSGRFVFSLLHPAFNNPGGTRLALEEEDRYGQLVETYYVKVSNYLRVPPVRGVGMPGEPTPHYYFHRSLSVLFGACFAAGF